MSSKFNIFFDLLVFQQMRRSGNRDENKRIIMDLDVVIKSHNCPYIVQCLGTFITSVSAPVIDLIVLIL